jgi:hypothetical protein
MLIRILTISVFVISTTALSAPSGVPPVQIQNGNDVVRSKFMWLDFGNVANNTTKSMTLTVTNVSSQTITVDAFSWSTALQVKWASPKPTPTLANRMELGPGESSALEIKAFFSDSNQTAEAISLMRSGVEITQIVGRQFIRPTPTLSKWADQRPAVFLFSGNGEGWSGWYELQLGAAPPGYTLDRSSVRFAVQEIQGEAHIRRCGAWAVCEELQRDETNVKYRFTVQGAHEGGLMQTNGQVRFYARLEATYSLKEGVTLAPFDHDLLEAFEAQPKPVQATHAVQPRLSETALSGIAFAAGGGGSIMNLPPPPQPEPLTQLQPTLANACDSGRFDACVELGVWVAAQAGRPNRVAEALDLLSKACTGGNARGCTWSGTVREGIDPNAAIQDLQKGCSQKDGLGCYQLAQLYKKSGQSSAKISATYISACQNGFPAPGCQGRVHVIVTKKGS